MHQYKTVVQILLILSVLNSARAVPVLLQKRPNEPQAATPVGPDAPPSIDLPSSSQPQLPDRPEHPAPQLPNGPGHPAPELPNGLGHPAPELMNGLQVEHPAPQLPNGFQHSGSELMTTSGHSEIQPYISPSGSPEHGEIQPYTSPPANPAHSGPQSMTIPPQSVNKAPSQAAWRQKIMTPERIKAAKYAGGAAVLTAAYLGLLLPEIIHNDKSSKGG